MMMLFSLIGGYMQEISSLLIDTAHAQISGGASQVSGGLFGSFGGGGFLGIVLTLMTLVRNLITALGVLLVVRAGLKLINSQDEGKISTARRTIASTCVGIMLAFLAERMVSAFYAPGGVADGNSALTGANILATEVAGIINWVTVLVAVVAVLMIVASGIKAIGSFGKEENAAEVKQTVIGVMTGLGLMMIAWAINQTLGLVPGANVALPGTPDATFIIVRIANIIINVMQYLALIAVVVVIYAGILMILNMGDEEQYGKAKGIIFRAMGGLVIILFSVLIARFVIGILV